MVYTERAETAAVSCGISHVSAVSTPLRWIFKTVSLVESGEQRYVKAINNQQQFMSVCLSVCVSVCLSVCLSVSHSLRTFPIEADLSTHGEKTHEEKRIVFIQYSTFLSFDTCGWSHQAAAVFEISFSDCMGNSTGREIR